MADNTPTGNINVVLSTTKESFLDTRSAYLFTVAFEGGNAHWSSIYDAATKTASSTAEIPLINSGKLYIIETNATLDELKIQITKESDITVNNATTGAHQFRFDSFEYALDASDAGGTPQGNLTSVNGFGFPMELKVDYTNGAASMTAGYAVSASTLTSHLQTAGSPLITFNSGGLAGQFLYAGSPSTASQGEYTRPPAFTDTHWTTYLQELGKQLASDPVRVTGIFNGAADTAGDWHNQAFYSYSASYVADSDTFVLTPEQNSQMKGTIKITAADLAKNIYAIDASTSADIYSVVDGVETLYKSEFLGANDQFGALFTQFLTGLDLGYLGQTGVSPNPDAASVNLNQNWNWSPIYAFGNNLVSGSSVTSTFDSYSKTLFDNSNSYGSQYSDNAMSQYPIGGPLLNLFQTVNGVNQNVQASQITLTIFDDSETPTGYVKPVLYDYIAAPEHGGYSTFADMSNATFANLVINLGIPAGSPGGDPSIGANRLAQTSWFADPDKFALSYEYLVGKDTWSNPAFVYQDTNSGDQLWSQWSLPAAGGKASITPGTTAGMQGTGALLLNNIPIGKTSGDIAWHRISVYDKSVSDWDTKEALKTFNFYTTSDGNGGFFYGDGKLAVDGRASFSTESVASGPTATLNLLVGSGPTIDPVLLTALPKPQESYATSGTIASAPVVGYFDATTKKFVAYSDQTNMTSPSATVKAANIVFAWTGLNPQATSDSSNIWSQYYTNKVSAQHTVKVTWTPFSDKDAGTAGSIETVADIDGKWETAPTAIAPGKYTVTMIEYMKVGDEYVQFAQASSPLTMTVQDTISAVRDSYLVSTGTPLVVQASNGTLANDLGSPTAALLATGPSNGSLAFNPDGSFIYTPSLGFSGTDSFQYFAVLDHGNGVTEKSIANVNLQVEPKAVSLTPSPLVLSPELQITQALVQMKFGGLSVVQLSHISGTARGSLTDGLEAFLGNDLQGSGNLNNFGSELQTAHLLAGLSQGDAMPMLVSSFNDSMA